MLEQNIIVKNVEVIMAIYLKMDQTQPEKDIAIMEYVWFLNLRVNKND